MVAAPLSIDGNAATILMVAPPLVDLPKLKATLNGAGQWTTAKLTATESAALALRSVASSVIATSRETFAVAPGLEFVKITTIRDEGLVGRDRWSVLLVVEITRASIERCAFAPAGKPAEKLLDALATETAVRFRAGSTRMLPLRESDVRGVERLKDLLGEWAAADLD